MGPATGGTLDCDLGSFGTGPAAFATIIHLYDGVVIASAFVADDDDLAIAGFALVCL